MTARKCDWEALDWSQGNHDIAALMGVSVWTAIRWRKRLGKPPGRRKPRRDIGIAQPHSIALGRANQPAATAGAKVSPRSGRGPDNVHAEHWHLRGPDGQTYRVRNLYDFVRTHAHLFAPADVAWKRTGGKRGTGGEYCNATAGILNIKHGRAKTWKGWTLLPLES